MSKAVTLDLKFDFRTFSERFMWKKSQASKKVRDIIWSSRTKLAVTMEKKRFYDDFDFSLFSILTSA